MNEENEIIDVKPDPMTPEEAMKHEMNVVGKAFEKMETVNELVNTLIRHPDYVFRVRYDPMDNKIVARLGTTRGAYAEMRYDLGSPENW